MQSLNPDRSSLNPDSGTLSGPPPIYKRGSDPPCKASGGITDKLAKHLELRAGIHVSTLGGPGVRQSPLGCEGCENYQQRGDNRLSREGYFTLNERGDITKVPENVSIAPSCPGSLRMGSWRIEKLLALPGRIQMHNQGLGQTRLSFHILHKPSEVYYSVQLSSVT